MKNAFTQRRATAQRLGKISTDTNDISVSTIPSIFLPFQDSLLRLSRISPYLMT